MNSALIYRNISNQQDRPAASAVLRMKLLLLQGGAVGASQSAFCVPKIPHPVGYKQSAICQLLNEFGRSVTRCYKKRYKLSDCNYLAILNM